MATDEHTLNLPLWNLAIPDEWAKTQSDYRITDSKVVGEPGSEVVRLVVEREGISIDSKEDSV